MAPAQCAAAVVDAFRDLANVRVTVESDPATLKAEYPLLAAVARASMHTPRHAPCVVRIDYTSPKPASVDRAVRSFRHTVAPFGMLTRTRSLYFVGKGITYDTGGADVKTGGAMRGMSRDKCGAAGVAGFLLTAVQLAPTHLNVTSLPEEKSPNAWMGQCRAIERVISVVVLAVERVRFCKQGERLSCQPACCFGNSRGHEPGQH